MSGNEPDAPKRRRRLPVPLPLTRPPAVSESTGSLRVILFERWQGQLLIGALAARILLWLVELVTGPTAIGDAIGSVIRVALVVSLAYFVWRLFRLVQQHLLWNVRQKLVVSYIFIGVIPTLLMGALLLFGAALMFLNISAYLFRIGIDAVVDDARLIAQATANELTTVRDPRRAAAILERRIGDSQVRYPGLSLAVVPRAGTRRGANNSTPVGSVPAAAAAGEWEHLPVPTGIPDWVSAGGFEGLVQSSPPGARDAQLAARGVAFSEPRDPTWGVIADVPLDEQVLEGIAQRTGIEPGPVSITEGDDTAEALRRSRATRASTVSRVRTAIGSTSWEREWPVFLDLVDWSSGEAVRAYIDCMVKAPEILDRVSRAQGRILEGYSFFQVTLIALLIVAILFLIIEAAAFTMGFTLARSITSSIHALFHGTERIRQGDLAHRISIPRRDQLGQLAESFNAMTSNIEDLLQQAAEKRRLEEELRIARDIQMSLLPRGTMQMRGLAVTALCVPAREVGGDYYDFFPLDEKRAGVLIADVAGKGTSAALYMAELKGLVLSLSRIHQSPRQLLIEVNRIISANLDSRSFITMTYAIIDIERRLLTYSRAGHTPLIHLPSTDGQPRRARVLTPNGMVLGLQLDLLAHRFEELLEELTVPLQTGDIFVLFTDGITEAMNMGADFFGEERLCALVEEHADLPSDELRERILREVESFVGDADPHDDMTMILLKVEDTVGEPALVGARSSMPHRDA
jgi:phosphoserine phosphatase RsbU/P